MYSLEHDGQVHNPLGGASYIFEEDVINWLLKHLQKSYVRISLGAQPNSSPHFGTLTTFCLAFALGSKINSDSKHTEIFFEVIDTAPFESREIEGIKYQISLRTSKISDKFIIQYEELLATLSNLSGISYKLRGQAEFNKHIAIPSILQKIANNKDMIGSILDPKKEKLMIRVACKHCGLADKHAIKTIIVHDGIKSFCPEHGWFESKFTNSDKFEYNTPLRNLIRTLVYSEDNSNPEINYEWLRVTGSDYAGFYQEQLLYKPTSLLGYSANDLPIIFYSPLVTDWSGAKLSKSLYVKNEAYKYLPNYVVNYESFKEKFGTKGIETMYSEVLSWLVKPYKLFRNYSVYYFMELFENAK